VDVCNLKC